MYKSVRNVFVSWAYVYVCFMYLSTISALPDAKEYLESVSFLARWEYISYDTSIYSIPNVLEPMLQSFFGIPSIYINVIIYSQCMCMKVHVHTERERWEG